MVRKSKNSLLSKSEIHQTDASDVKCTKLPEFIRAKKYLGASFCVYFEEGSVQDGVRVTISAGNYKNPTAELKNNESVVRNNVAEFQDLRFLGKSGRGTKFNVYIKLETDPQRVITYLNAIKVTVDGPRPPRNVKPKIQEVLQNSEEFLDLKRKCANQFILANKNSYIEKSSSISSQPIKKRFRHSFFMDDVEEGEVRQTFSTMSMSQFSHSTNTSSMTSSPAISPNPSFSSTSLDVLAETACDMHKQCSGCCASLESLSLNCHKEQDGIDGYKEMVNSYLNLFMDMYKIKINKELSNYLVNLILSKARASSGSGLGLGQINARDNISVTENDDQQFIATYQLFYMNLMQNFGKTNLEKSCLSLNQSSYISNINSNC